MARLGNKIILGYEDEVITEKYLDKVDYTTSKVGGQPNWCGPPTQVACKLCGLDVPLVLQIYAPLNNSPYHRTLYVFGCINPNCWNQSASWTCVRGQCLASTTVNLSNQAESVLNATDWCSGADNWGDEENGNFIESDSVGVETQDYIGISDEMSELSVNDKNANTEGGSGLEGAMGTVPTATAMIEGDEEEVVTIDTPTRPEINLVAVLEEVSDLPQNVGRFEFCSFFLSVGDEDLSGWMSPEDHVKEMIKEYRSKGSEVMEEASGDSSEQEHYEKSLPAHGDKMFHQFLTRLHASPGHFVRYGGFPLPLYPMKEVPRVCRHCGSETMFELQILPTLIPRLRLAGEAASWKGRLEFGTVLIFSCRDSCWSLGDTFKEESVIVQQERIR